MNLDKFCATNYVTVFRDLEEYNSRTRKMSRYYVALILKVITVLHCIRWCTATLIRNEQANLILFNFGHMLEWKSDLYPPPLNFSQLSYCQQFYVI